MSSIQLPPLLQDDPGPGHEHRPPGPHGPITYQILLEPSVKGWLSGPPNPFSVSTQEGRRPRLETPEWVAVNPFVAFRPPSRPTQSPPLTDCRDGRRPTSTTKTNTQVFAHRSFGRTAKSVSSPESRADATGPLSPSSSFEATTPPTRKRRGYQPYPPRELVEVNHISQPHASAEEEYALGRNSAQDKRPHPVPTNNSTGIHAVPSRLKLSDGRPRTTGNDKAVLPLGTHPAVSVSKTYLEDCRERAFEIFPMKLAGIGAAIEKRSVLPTSHLWTHRDPPKLATLKARTALLLLVIYYGHINPRPSPANPSGLSVEPQTFAQLLLHEAHNLLKDLDWGCISNKSALLGINPILLYGFHCFENQEKWPAFEPIITKAINADRSPTSTEKKKSLHALGEDPTLFHSNSLKQQIWRRATFALIVLASLGSLAHYEISAAELELPLPLNIRYTDIEENNHILETVEAMEELSDAGLLIMNGRLAIAKSRLLDVLRSVARSKGPISRSCIFMTVLPAVEVCYAELRDALASLPTHTFPSQEQALTEVKEVAQLSRSFDVRRLISLVARFPLVDALMSDKY